MERCAGRRRRRRRTRLVNARAGLGRLQGRPARLRARVRRADRRGTLELQPGAARGRSGDSHVARRGVALQRRRQRLVDVQRRRRARPRLRADVGCHERHVRRSSARQQPVRQLDRCAECQDRRARLALSNRASRSVRLRLAGRAGIDRHHRRRPADQGAGASHEARLPVRARSRDRRARVADRGTAGAEVDGARRGDEPDATASDEAAAVRAPRAHRE